jgi:hypothetical protein
MTSERVLLFNFQAVEENDTLATILESIPEEVETLTFYQI